MSQFAWLSPVEAAQVASRRGTATKVTKDAGGSLKFEMDEDSELAEFTKHVNEHQSAWSGVGAWTNQGRLRLLAKELSDLADAAERAGIEQA